VAKPWHETAAELLAKATPGPWFYSETQDDDPVVYVEANDAATVLFESDWGKLDDAILIAAAPTLLKAALEERAELRDDLLTSAARTVEARLERDALAARVAELEVQLEQWVDHHLNDKPSATTHYKRGYAAAEAAIVAFIRAQAAGKFACHRCCEETMADDLERGAHRKPEGG